jgi:hypothetical protein
LVDDEYGLGYEVDDEVLVVDDEVLVVDDEVLVVDDEDLEAEDLVINVCI